MKGSFLDDKKRIEETLQYFDNLYFTSDGKDIKEKIEEIIDNTANVLESQKDLMHRSRNSFKNPYVNFSKNS